MKLIRPTAHAAFTQRRRGLSAWVLAAAMLPCGLAGAHCVPGAYGLDAQRQVVLTTPPAPAPGGAAGSGAVAGAQRYLFADGRRGWVDAPSSPVRCSPEGQLSVDAGGPSASTWPRLALIETDTQFVNAATRLAGRLIEPADTGAAAATRSLVVLVHGSERTPAIGTAMGYLLAAQGLAVFVYDKRGTGRSGGEYGQNFELLADDAAAAWRHARTMAAGRHQRAGFFGASQGGWVAPLAAGRARADFVAVAYGLVASPIEEDLDQLLDEAQRAALDERARGQIRQLSAATARIVRSHFTTGFDELASLRQALAGEPWVASIQGEYSGDMLRMADGDLRRIGRARFDNLELLWDYDAPAALRRLQAPLLWVLAAQDREAPPARSRQALAQLQTGKRNLWVAEYPDTDHGMVEFSEDASGQRQATRVTDGYFRLLADWMTGRIGTPPAADGRYGRATWVIAP